MTLLLLRFATVIITDLNIFILLVLKSDWLKFVVEEVRLAAKYFILEPALENHSIFFNNYKVDDQDFESLKKGLNRHILEFLSLLRKTLRYYKSFTV